MRNSHALIYHERQVISPRGVDELPVLKITLHLPTIVYFRTSHRAVLLRVTSSTTIDYSNCNVFLGITISLYSRDFGREGKGKGGGARVHIESHSTGLTVRLNESLAAAAGALVRAHMYVHTRAFARNVIARETSSTRNSEFILRLSASPPTPTPSIVAAL